MFGLFSMLTPRWAVQRDPVYIDPIPIYIVSIRADCAGFDVEVTSCDGSSQKMYGFETVTDAHACMAHNKLMAGEAYLKGPSGFQTSWWS